MPLRNQPTLGLACPSEGRKTVVYPNPHQAVLNARTLASNRPETQARRGSMTADTSVSHSFRCRSILASGPPHLPGQTENP